MPQRAIRLKQHTRLSHTISDAHAFCFHDPTQWIHDLQSIISIKMTQQLKTLMQTQNKKTSIAITTNGMRLSSGNNVKLSFETIPSSVQVLNLTMKLKHTSYGKLDFFIQLLSKRKHVAWNHIAKKPKRTTLASLYADNQGVPLLFNWFIG